MKSIAERAQIFLDALHLYNPELKHQNDETNKEAIIKMLTEQHTITADLCQDGIREIPHENKDSPILIRKASAIQVAINVKVYGGKS